MACAVDSVPETVPGTVADAETFAAEDGDADKRQTCAVTTLVPAFGSEEPGAEDLDAVTILAPAFGSEEPVCSRCNHAVDPGNAQIRGNKWTCNSCNSRIAMLYRTFGRWPIDEFNEFSNDEQVAFFQKLRSEGGVICKAQMKNLVLNQLAKRRVDKNSQHLSGDFLPLSAWAQKGFDVSLIESLTEDADVMEHPVLGKCYRVAIHGHGTSIEQQTIREQILKGSGSVRKRAALKDTPETQSALFDPKKADIPLGQADPLEYMHDAQGFPEEDLSPKSPTDSDDESSDSSDSSSDSSTSDKKKKNKKKKAKASKKPVKRKPTKSRGKSTTRKSKKEQQAEMTRKRKVEADKRADNAKTAKEEQKRKSAITKVHAFATKVVAKVKVCVAHVEKSLGNTNKSVPDVAIDQAKASLAELVGMQTSCEMALRDQDCEPLDFTWVEVNKAVKDAMGAASTINLLVKHTSKLLPKK